MLVSVIVSPPCKLHQASQPNDQCRPRPRGRGIGGNTRLKSGPRSLGDESGLDFTTVPTRTIINTSRLRRRRDSLFFSGKLIFRGPLGERTRPPRAEPKAINSSGGPPGGQCPLCPPKADIDRCSQDVRFVPKADISQSCNCKQKDRLSGGLSEISCAHKPAVRAVQRYKLETDHPCSENILPQTDWF